MIGLGLRLAVAGGRSAAGRLALVGAAVAVGVALLLGTLAGINAVQAQNLRYAWLNSAVTSAATGPEAADPAGWALRLVLGFALFPLVRLGLAGFTLTGERFFTGDLSLSTADVLLVALGVPVGAAVAARIALRRVRISPLGVSRRVTPKPPRAWRLLPVAAGLAELVWFVGRRPDTTNGQLIAYLSGIVLVMTGLVVAGPWLTMTGSRLLAHRAGRPATLIAGRRLADDPRAGFRAVSGLMLALFVTTVATGVITTVVNHRGAQPPGSAIHDNLTVTWYPEEQPPGTSPPPAAAVPAALRTTAGVEDVIAVHGQEPAPGHLAGLVDCAALARVPQVGRCPAGAAVAETHHDLFDPRDGGERVWLPSPLTPAQLAERPLLSVVVVTDGSAAALNRARTLLQGAFPDAQPAATQGEWRSNFANSLVQFQRLADVVIVASLLIAGCSLAVSVTGGINERARPFSLLRLAGVRLPELRRVVLLESVVPLLAVAMVAVGAGFLAAHLFLRSQLGYRLDPPGPAYYATVLLGLGLSLVLIVSTMPLLRRVTGPAAARNE
ncbi:FtsX-like permease family protein [Paractinoplanes rishiriensis]|uniref:ABC3 transporter permease C-terminal domain-containing protein n=1 Tax=Paractinoplanes rishiriensis TaxID=1050105 RepID=A0A919MXF8_9ACTN|nr:FtsX-like permease family protein [Actinoplanes rishiriensis]GIE98843.1 hypothetical protein Ari01nite_63080 [Actinoplanes rishiriensis]